MWGWLSYVKPSIDFGGGSAMAFGGVRVAVDEQELPRLREVLPRVSAEFARARRYERPVTVAVFTAALGDAVTPPQAGGNGHAGRQDTADRRLAPVLAAVARQAMREIDIVCCDADAGCCIAVMPEIGLEEGQQAVRRMRRLCTEQLGRATLAGIAVYPRDGWMFLDLVDAAQRHALA